MVPHSLTPNVQNAIVDDASKRSPRIPLALQKVFLTSNSGKEVTEVPEGNVASKVFPKGQKSKHYISKATSLFKNKHRGKSDCKKLLNDVPDTSSANTKLTVSTCDSPKRVPDKIQYKKVDKARHSPKKCAPSRERASVDLSPQDFLDRLLSSRGYSTSTRKTLESGYYAVPTHLQQFSYHDHLISLAINGQNKKLKEIMNCGISPNPCNIYGESLVHTVCRRCKWETLQILLDAGTSLQVSDGYGRTPLHDACWRAEPCFGIIEMIASRDLFLFQMADCRDITPLAYIPKEQWERWNEFLDSKKDVWWPIKVSSRRSSIADVAPNSRPIQNPKNALKPEIAAMVTAGKIKPTDAINFDMEKDISDLSDSLQEYSTDEDSCTDDEDSISSVSDSSEDDESITASEEDLEDILFLIASAKRH